MFSQTAQKLLHFLSDYACHGGTTLADSLGITRQAVWKAIQELNTLGVPIHTIGKKGYQLQKGFECLSASVIENGLSNALKACSPVIRVVDEVSSTNDVVHQLPLSPDSITVLMAEKQTQGRGRLERVWHSPFAANLNLSAKMILPHYQLSVCSALSPLIGVMVAKALRQFGIAATVKWPNDVWYQNQKLVGILIELSREAEGQVVVVIGIGINMADIERPLNQAYTSCEKILGHLISRNLLASKLIEQLAMLRKAETLSHHQLPQIWSSYSALYGQKVILRHSEIIAEGIECGIQQDGALCIETADGIQKAYSIGELSLRPAVLGGHE